MATSFIQREGPGDPIRRGHMSEDEGNDTDAQGAMDPARTDESSGSNSPEEQRKTAVNNLLAQLVPRQGTTTDRPTKPQQEKETAVNGTSAAVAQSDGRDEPTATEIGNDANAVNDNGVMDQISEVLRDQTMGDANAMESLNLAAHQAPGPSVNGNAVMGQLSPEDVLATSQISQEQHFPNQRLETDSIQPVTSLGPPFIPSQLENTGDGFPSPQSDLQRDDLPDHMQRSQEKGQIEAFAKLEFTDGNYYITTHLCELGRDVRALRAAEDRERSGGSDRHRSSSAKRSHSAFLVQREEEGVHGSVVSERGGFCGLDDREHESIQHDQGKHSSISGSDVIKPEDMHLSTKQTFDYAGAVMLDDDDDEQARPVDASALLPSPDQNPLIPIHPTTCKDGAEEIAAHKSISRRHVRIQWNFERTCFELIILGRNGAFLNGRWHAKGVALPLEHGSHIQIGEVEVKFKLPVQAAISELSDTADSLLQDDEARAVNGDDDDIKDSIENDDSGPRSKPGPRLKLISKKKPAMAGTEDPGASPEKPAVAPVGPVSGNPDQPVKRRGPGRPPKDGIMSNRERREIEKAKKLAAAKEANGGVTPPPTGRAKIVKTIDSVDPEIPKPEKRKYTKRKRPDGTPGDGNGEGGSGEEDDDDKPSAKKAREEKSPSPEYPAESTFTEEQLAKPPYNYTVLIFEALQEAGKPLTLRNVYRKLKLKYPYFVHRCPTDGWQSSVRHNLNGTPNLFEHAARDGKGWSWKIVEGATIEREKKRKPEPVERPDQTVQQRYPPPGGRPGQPYGYSYPPHYPPGAPPPPGMPYYPPNVASGQYQQQQGQAPFAAPGQPYMGPPRGPGTPVAASNAAPQAQPSGMGMLRPGQPPPAPQPYRGPPNQQPPNRPQQPPPHSRPPGGPGHPYPPPAPRPAGPDPLLPCTPDGLTTIQNFQNAILADTPEDKDKKILQATFQSVRARVLGGRKQSLLPGGETEQERVLLGHVQELVKRFPNKFYNAEMVRQREEDRARREAEAKANAAAGGTVTNGSTTPNGAVQPPNPASRDISQPAGRENGSLPPNGAVQSKTVAPPAPNPPNVVSQPANSPASAGNVVNGGTVPSQEALPSQPVEAKSTASTTIRANSSSTENLPPPSANGSSAGQASASTSAQHSK